MTRDDAPVFDRAQLDRYTMGDHALQTELFGLFFDEAEAQLDHMEAALANGAPQAWRDAAHSMKGSAGSLGLIALREVVTRAEGSTPNAMLLSRTRSALREARRAAHRMG